MKNLVLVCISLVFFAGKSIAQNADQALSTAELKQRMALDDPRLYQRYKTGSTLSGIGCGVTLGGVAAVIIGIASADKETQTNGLNTQVYLSGPGAGIFAAGLVAALVGTPVWIVGHSIKKNTRSSYLRQYGDGSNVPVHPSPYLQLNSVSNGLGLAFVF